MPRFLLTSSLLFLVLTNSGRAQHDFVRDVKPLLQRYCGECHAGDDAAANVDFSSMKTQRDVEVAYDTWESLVQHLNNRTMPPADAAQPTDENRELIVSWYEHLTENVKERPAEFRPRRLSVAEYRNTLRSLFGFDLEVAIIEAEQTRAERSLVRKLLPTDPPGGSGFKNDTHQNPLTTVAWDQYGYLTESALEDLFSTKRRPQLEAFAGPMQDDMLTSTQAATLLHAFVRRAQRRDLSAATEGQAVSCRCGQVRRSIDDGRSFRTESDSDVAAVHVSRIAGKSEFFRTSIGRRFRIGRTTLLFPVG